MNDLRRRMTGATAEMRANLEKTNGPEVAHQVEAGAVAIIRALPEMPLGVRVAALMLAATAYGEYGVAAAEALVREKEKDA